MQETVQTRRAVSWLLQSEDPSIRYLTLTSVLGKPLDAPDVESARKQIPQGPKVRVLLSGHRRHGGFGVHPYQKWTGAHWRLVSLVELGIPPGFKPAVRATDLVLKWLLGDAHLKNVPKINGLYRRCASQEGNALAVCSRLGIAKDPRVKQLAESLMEWQWPDGGWNCDRNEDVHHSSFNESLSTLWGLVEYTKSTDDDPARDAAEKAAEFFLKHKIFRSCKTNQIRPPETFNSRPYPIFVHPFTDLHYPLYWHYDILQALTILSRAGKLNDPRTREAMDLIESKRLNDGTWKPDDYYWRLKRTSHPKLGMQSNVEIVDWGRKGPNEMITLNALRVLSEPGRV